MTKESTSRGRGRPKGATDSYPRIRRYGKAPPKQQATELMPIIHALIQAAHTVGQHIHSGRVNKRAVEEEDKILTQLMMEIKKLTG